MAAAPPRSRAKERPAGDEEATATLKLGEFENVPTLNLSEARMLIDAVIKHRQGGHKVEETE
jgi:DNA-directed RNA polymerase II subunit RPB4